MTTALPASPPVPTGSLTATAVIETELRGGRTVLRTLRSDPPLTLRRTAPERIHLVSSAAGPLGGDRLRLVLRLAPGTRLELRSVASSLVLPGSGESVLTVEATVGSGASLRFAPEPTVLAAGCHHRTRTLLELAEDASVYWREELVFGRHGEPPGRCRSRFDATVGDRPLLRQEFTVGDPRVDASPAVFGTARCVGSTLLAGAPPTGTARPAQAVVGDGVAVLPLAGPGTLVSALAQDAVALRRRLEWGEAHCR